MNLEALFPIVIPAAFVALIAVERLWPARPLPRVPGWRVIGVLAFVATGALSAAVPLLYMDAIRARRLLDLEGLGTAPGAVLAFLVTQLAGYWFHRLRHTRVLWRVHQLHHSAERLDIFGGAYFHPLDIAGENLVGALAATTLLGVSGQAAAAAGLVSVCLSLFQHTNVRTPRWLGYLVQRPEAHSVHHARGVHAYNYADLPLWDLVFGTFRNPERFEPEAGFWDGASRRIPAMLACRDVTAPPSPIPVTLRGADPARGRPDGGRIPSAS
jgi:sterol desaturase/sphingolipid hydroxylase (fatty acid hydroxylase superfamily)